MDIIKLLNELESLVEETHTVMGFAWNFNQEEFMDLLNKVRASLPDDIKRASRLTQESQNIVEGAREQAEQARIDAQAEAERVVREAEATVARLTQAAEADSSRRINDASGQSQKMLADATAQARKAVADATAQAQKMLSEANAESQRLINASEVMKLASVQAREIVSVAENDSQDMRRGADEYAHGVLLDLERQVGDLLSTIQKGRGKLDQRVSGALAPPVTHANGRANGELAAPRR